jgi:hypothetical protein
MFFPMFHFFGGFSFNPNTQIFGWTVVSRSRGPVEMKGKGVTWNHGAMSSVRLDMLCLSYVESI